MFLDPHRPQKLLHSLSVAECSECLFLEWQQSTKRAKCWFIAGKSKPKVSHTKHVHFHGWGECPAHKPLSHILVIEVTASEQFWLQGQEGRHVWTRVLWKVHNPSESWLWLVFWTISAGPSSHQAFILLLLGSLSTVEPPVIMQFDFYPWVFDFTFHHH